MPSYKDEKTNTWYCQFYYKDWGGRQKHTIKRGFLRKKDAEKYEREFKTRQQTQDITISMLIELYLDNLNDRIKLNALKASSKARYKELIDYYIVPYFPQDLQIKKLTASMINKWLVSLTDYITIKQKKKLSKRTIMDIKSQFSTILNFAIKNNLLSTNPVNLSERIPAAKQSKKTVWSVDDYNLFYSKISKEMHRIIFNLMYWCGLRVGEVLALTPANLTADGKLNIKNTIYRNQVNNAKTPYSVRSIILPSFLYSQLKNYVAGQYGIKDTDRIFNITYSGILEYMTRKQADLDIPKLTPHGLRHSNASLLLNLTKDYTLVSHNLGHKNPQITLSIYAHMIPGADEKAADALNSIAVNVPKKAEFNST